MTRTTSFENSISALPSQSSGLSYMMKMMMIMSLCPPQSFPSPFFTLPSLDAAHSALPSRSPGPPCRPPSWCRPSVTLSMWPRPSTVPAPSTGLYSLCCDLWLDSNGAFFRRRNNTFLYHFNHHTKAGMYAKVIFS